MVDTGEQDVEDADATDSDQQVDESGVVVPLRVYKTVTVFSTLLSFLFVVSGFIVLDAATDRASAPIEEIDPVLAVVGVISIAFGAAVYAFSARFRSRGMGNAKDRTDE